MCPFSLEQSLASARSANPFVAGWYGAEVIRLIPFIFKNVWNSSLVKAVPLSDMTVSGNPWVAKVDLSTEIIFEQFVEGTVLASIHFEWACPVWSMCILDQDWFGHSQRCKWAGIGDFCANWHASQSFAFLSISASTLNHQMIPLVILFILRIPECPSWSYFNTHSWPPWGIFTRFPHIIQPSWTLNSLIRFTRGSICGWSSGVRSPCWTLARTLDRIGSLSILWHVWH